MTSPILHLMPKQRQMQYPFGQPPAGADVLWRVEAKSYSYVIDADREEYGVTSPVLEATWWTVEKRTEYGARLDCGKFVYLDDRITRRRWASPTIEEALVSFKARRDRQASILSGQLDWARYELALAEAVSL